MFVFREICSHDMLRGIGSCLYAEWSVKKLKKAPNPVNPGRKRGINPFWPPWRALSIDYSASYKPPGCFINPEGLQWHYPFHHRVSRSGKSGPDLASHELQTSPDVRSGHESRLNLRFDSQFRWIEPGETFYLLLSNSNDSSKSLDADAGC